MDVKEEPEALLFGEDGTKKRVAPAPLKPPPQLVEKKVKVEKIEKEEREKEEGEESLSELSDEGKCACALLVGGLSSQTPHV